MASRNEASTLASNIQQSFDRYWLNFALIFQDVTDQFKTGQWLSNQNQPLLWLVKGLR